MIDARRKTISHLAALGILLAAIAFAFFDVLGSDRGFMFRDHQMVFRPRWYFISEALRSLHLPTLVHGSSSGVPLEALFTATYTPPTLLLLFGEFDTVYDFFVIAHYAILASGVYVLAISLGARRHEATLSAAIATLTGPVLSLENLLMFLQGLAYAPWVYWAYVRLLRNATAPRAGILAISIGFHLQDMIPELAILDLLAGAALLIQIRPRITARTVGLLTVATMLGLGLASIVFMPVLEFLPHTRRGIGFAYEEAGRWALQPAQIVDFLAPGFFAPPDIPFLYVPVVTDGKAPYFSSLYLGISLPLGFVAARSREHRKAALALLLVLVITALTAMGPATPLHRMISTLPILRSSRFPVKYLIIVVACLSVMVPLGIRSAQSHPRALVVGLAIQVAIAGGVLSVLSSQDEVSWLARFLESHPRTALPIGVSQADFALLFVSAMRSRILHGFGFSLAALSLAGVMMVRKAHARTLLTLLAPLALVDLSLAAHHVVFGAPVRAAPSEEILRRIDTPHHRMYAATPMGLRPSYRHDEGHTYFEDAVRSALLRGRNPYRNIRLYADEDLDAQSNTIAVLGFELLQVLPKERAERLLARAGVAWVSIARSEGAPGELDMQIPGEAPQYFVPVPGVRPYVHSYAEWRTFDRETIPRHQLAEILTAPEQMQIGILWAGRAAEGMPSETTTSTGCAAQVSSTLPPSATLRSESRPDRIVVDHASQRPALLVALETNMPGWVASIDDQPAWIHTAELGHLGVVVPPGEHRVRFEYISRASRWAPFSLLSAFLTLALLLNGDAKHGDPKNRDSRNRGTPGDRPTDPSTGLDDISRSGV